MNIFFKNNFFLITYNNKVFANSLKRENKENLTIMGMYILCLPIIIILYPGYKILNFLIIQINFSFIFLR